MAIEILLAEDEHIERLALRKFLEETFDDSVRIHEASNGFEMEEYILTKKLDIIIADIEMPGKSGLQALTKIKSRQDKPRIIIQTAFGQFDYAHKAIEVEADAFLLKPIKNEVLKEKIEAYIQQIEDKRNQISTRINEMRLLEKSRVLIESDIVTSIQLGLTPVELFELYAEYIGTQRTRSLVITFRTITNGIELGSRGVKEELIKHLREFGKNYAPIIVGRFINEQFSIILSLEEASTYKQTMTSLQHAQTFLEVLQKEFSCKFSVGIGLPKHDINNLPLSYQESLQALDNTSKAIPIVHYNDIRTKTHNKLLLSSWISELKRGIRTGNKMFIAKTIQNAIPEMSLDKNTFPVVIDDMVALVLQLQSECLPSVYEMPSARIALPKYLDELEKYTEVEDLRGWLQARLFELSDKIIQNQKDVIHVCVQKAITYIQKNYKQDLSLDFIAEEIGISPYYLSHLFKQEIGKTYIQFLTDIRLEEADQLIDTAKFSLSEISYKVGYNSASYFAKVYKKHHSVTIRDQGGICVRVGK